MIPNWYNQNGETLGYRMGMKDEREKKLKAELERIDGSWESSHLWSFHQGTV